MVRKRRLPKGRSVPKRILGFIAVVVTVLAVSTAPANAVTSSYTWNGTLNAHLRVNAGPQPGTDCTIAVSSWANAPYAYPAVGWQAYCNTRHSLKVWATLYYSNTRNGPLYTVVSTGNWYDYGWVSYTTPMGAMVHTCAYGPRYWTFQAWLMVDGRQTAWPASAYYQYWDDCTGPTRQVPGGVGTTG